MSILAESIIAAFDSNADIQWSLETTSRAIARFSLPGAKVEVTFQSNHEDSYRWPLRPSSGFEAHPLKLKALVDQETQG